MKNAIQMMESKMSPEMVKKAHKQAEQEILAIRLSQLREEQNIKQTNLKNFSQSSVSKIEKRKDMKISTLVSYLDSIWNGSRNQGICERFLNENKRKNTN
ncbi:XRE family transcriptional regulator [Treponema peruense]|uniref:XRE family transcriptional regulator n=1 Tax=Treponema peruense TaxID=2787628 RepID=UPI001E5C8EB3|nr:XRE family transcriptional regulator [Treponema peruense]